MTEYIRPNLEAEQSVIGAILVDPDRVMPECMEMLDENDFLITEYRTIYRTCSGYSVDGKPVDHVILITQLGDGYKAVLAEALQIMPSISNWKSYAGIVKRTAIRHRAFEACQELSRSLLDGADLADCQTGGIKLCETFNITARDNTLSSKQGLDLLISNSKVPRQYIQSGFSNLDTHTYLALGDFMIIGARPSVGKTAITLQMALHMARKHRVVYFSLETSGIKLFDRMAASYFDIPLNKIKSGGGLDMGNIYLSRSGFDGLNLHVVEASGWTVAQIQSKAVQLKAEIAFIDYLGLVRAEGGSRYEKITNTSVDLHTMAQSRKMCVVALSQLNREGKGEPDMSHLRESGQIEQDADIILLLHNMGEKENFGRKLIIAKNKEGRTGALRFSFNGEYQKFAEIEARYDG